MQKPIHKISIFRQSLTGQVHYKTRASILQYVLTIGLLSIMLLSGFVGWIYYVVQIKKIQKTEIEGQKKVQDLMLFLPNEIEIPLGEKQMLSDSIGLGTALEIEHRFHGIFNWYGINGIVNKKAYHKSAFYGDVSPNPSMSLMIPNNGRTLYLAGRAELSGTVYTSGGGIRSSAMGGTNSSFSSKQIGQLNIKKSEAKLPQIAADLKQHLHNLIDDRLWSPQEFTQEQGSVVHSFSKPLKIIEFNEFKSLAAIQYIGNVWIRSTFPIEIQASAVLKDVLITAPKITIEEGFTGQFQAIASKSIHVEKNCFLQYPSVLWVKELDSISSTSEGPKIFIGSDSNVLGYVGYEQNNPSENPPAPDLYIEDRAKVYGQVYVMGNTELKGAIQGSLYSEDIVAFHQGILYKNHLFNGKILIDQRVSEFVDFRWENPRKQKIMQWLY